ncbi:MAG: insulinase family protein [Bryobacteraceae bacterium]|nr:insulinase family protein [Bryobacteraceae bacterium]
MTPRLLVFTLAAAAIMSAQVKLPPYSKKALPNGATLILLNKPDVPLVTVRALFRGGAEAESAAQAGINALTVELMRRGAGARPAEEFAEALDALGASLNTGANRQFSFASVEFLTRTQSEALALFGDFLARPTFPEDEFKKALAQRIDASKAAKDNPGAALALFFPSFFYGPGHPYARPSNGDELSLANLTRQSLVDWHKRMFVGRNLILIAAGDIDEKTLGPRLEKLASALPAGEAYQWRQSVAPPERKQPRLLLIDKPDATQTYFMVATPGIDRTHPDRTQLEIVNTLFGGRFTSMLNDELRVNSGLTYGARSSVDEDRLTGAISISTFTPAETTVKAIDLALEVLNRLRTQGIDTEQLLSARNYIKGGFPTQNLETADQVAGILGELEIFGLNKGEIDDYFSRLDAATLEQVNATAKKWYGAAPLQFLLVGNAEKIREDVKKYAPNMKVRSIKEPGFGVPAF